MLISTESDSDPHCYDNDTGCQHALAHSTRNEPSHRSDDKHRKYNQDDHQASFIGPFDPQRRLTEYRGPTTTVTKLHTKHVTDNTTITTYVSPSATFAAAAVAPPCNASHAMSVLGSMSNGTLADACSCIGNPVATSTTTMIITAAPVQTQTTEFAGTAPTTTIYKISRKTFTTTVAPTAYVKSKTTIWATSTKTESYAAPTFSHVFGPKTGCADIAPGPARSLDASIDNFRNATQECQDVCAQEARCAFVFVQQTLAHQSKDASRFQCSFGDHRFDEAKDLECGKQKGTYGTAIGFDACDRGTKQL